MTESNENPFRRRPKAAQTEPEADDAAIERRVQPEKSGDHASFTDQDPAAASEQRDPREAPRRHGKGKVEPRGRLGVQRRDERGAGGLRRLPNDLVALADGRADRVKRPRRAPDPIEDERIGFVFPGVRNMDARLVMDARVAELRAAHGRGDRELLGNCLCDATRMQIWRARNVLDFAAFAEHVVGMDGADAERLARTAAERAEVTLDALPPHVVALWMRTEAALSRACPDARITVRGTGKALTLQLLMPVNDVSRAVLGFFDMGGAANGLRPFLRDDAGPAASRERNVRDAAPRKLASDNERGGSRKQRKPRDRG